MTRRSLTWLAGRMGLFAALLVYFLVLRLYSGYDLGTEWVDADVGVRAVQTVRMLNGELPYRDFWAHYPPYSYYVNTGLFKVFGVRLSAFRTGLAFVGAITCFLAYIITRRVASRGAAVTALVLCLSWSVVDLNINYTTWYCVPLALGASWFTLVGTQGRARWPWVAAGICAGLTFGLKLNYGLFVVTAVGLSALAERQLDAKPLAKHTGTALLLAAGLGGVALIRDALSLTTLVHFGLPIAGCASWALIAARSATGSRAVAGPRLWLVAGGAALPLLPWLPYFAVRWEVLPFLDQALLGFVRYAGAVVLAPPTPTFRTILLGIWLVIAPLAHRQWRTKHPKRSNPTPALALLGTIVLMTVPSSLNAPDPWAYTLVKSWVQARHFVPAVAIWYALAVLWKNRQLDTAETGPLFALTASAAAVLLTWYPYGDVNHLQWCWPPAVILGCVLLDRHVKSSTERTAVVWGLPIAAACVQWFALTTHFHRPETAGGPWRMRAMTLAAPPRGDVLVPANRAATIQEAVQLLRATTARDAPVLELYGHLLGFLAERPNPTRYDYFWPGWLTEAEQRAAVVDLERRPPPYVIGHKQGAGDDPLARFTDAFPVLGGYLTDRYRPAQLIGPYQFYVRRPAPA